MSHEQETKVCKHCQSEIPKKAKVCPNCRKKQRGIFKWILIAAVVLVFIGSSFGGGDDSASDSNPQKVGDVSGLTKENDTKEEVKNKFYVGEIVETSKLRITFVSAKEYQSDNQFIQPKAGNVYYEMEFEVENISDSNQNVSSWDFDCYADNYDMEQVYMDGMDLDATLSAGKKTKGSVFFEVPEDAKEISLEYETNFWTEDKIIFVVK